MRNKYLAIAVSFNQLIYCLLVLCLDVDRFVNEVFRIKACFKLNIVSAVIRRKRFYPGVCVCAHVCVQFKQWIEISVRKICARICYVFVYFPVVFCVYVCFKRMDQAMAQKMQAMQVIGLVL